jgi:hypothetical protein
VIRFFVLFVAKPGRVADSYVIAGTTPIIGRPIRSERIAPGGGGVQRPPYPGGRVGREVATREDEVNPLGRHPLPGGDGPFED